MRQFGAYLRGVFPASNHEWSHATTVGSKEANMWEALENAAKHETGQGNGGLRGITEQIS